MTVSDAAGIIYQVLPEPQAGLLTGILFGVKASMSKSLYESLVATGTLHIIALSGQNISILIGIISLILFQMVRRPIANILSLGMIVVFISFVGPSPSVIRAGIMGAITLMGISLGRQIWPLVVWAATVASMLIYNPSWVADLSFQLSVMATLGILLFGEAGPAARSYLGLIRGLFYGLMADLRVTLAAQVFTIPIIMFAFGRISLVSPLSNLLIGWLIVPIMIGGFLLVALGVLWVPLAQPVAWLVWVPLTFVIRVVEWTAKIPFASIRL